MENNILLLIKRGVVQKMKRIILLLVLVCFFSLSSCKKKTKKLVNQVTSEEISHISAIKNPIFIKKNTYTTSKIVYGGDETVDAVFKGIQWENHTDYERVILILSGGLPFYKILYEQYPCRLVVILSYTRPSTDFIGINKPDKSLYVSKYPFSVNYIETLKKDDYSFCIIFENYIEYEVISSQYPPGIAIDIRSNKHAFNLPKVFSIRTHSVEGCNIDYLKDIWKILIEKGSKNARFLISKERSFIIEEGYYSTKKEATEKLRLLSKFGFKGQFVVEERGPFDIPSVINLPGESFDNSGE